MSPSPIHRRLVERSLAGRYDVFLGVGGGLAILGLILFVTALAGGSPSSASAPAREICSPRVRSRRCGPPR